MNEFKSKTIQKGFSCGGLFIVWLPGTPVPRYLLDLGEIQRASVSTRVYAAYGENFHEILQDFRSRKTVLHTMHIITSIEAPFYDGCTHAIDCKRPVSAVITASQVSPLGWKPIAHNNSGVSHYNNSQMFKETESANVQL
ncbi:hypothetical protein CBL_13098 [Carabus blaptoides fortunei]